MGIVVIADRANGFALELLRGGSSGIAFLLDERLPGIGAVLGALRELQMGQSVLDPSIVDSLIRRGTDVGIDDLTRERRTCWNRWSRPVQPGHRRRTPHLGEVDREGITTIS